MQIDASDLYMNEPEQQNRNGHNSFLTIELQKLREARDRQVREWRSLSENNPDD